MMVRPLLTILLLAGFPTTLLAAEPFVRAEVATKGRIIAGQQIELAVDVFVPNFFKAAPDFPVFQLANAIVVLPDSRAQNLVTTVNGEQYAGIRRTYAVIPEIAGVYTLPATTIAVAYADQSGAMAQGLVTLPPTTFSTGEVPGDWRGQVPFIATNVTVTQLVDRDPASLKVGDALVRTVTIAADDTRAMMIPAERFDAPEGVKLYSKNPILTDDGSSVPDDPDASLRVETVIYLMQKPGSFTLPAVELEWLRPADTKIAVATAPAIRAMVVAAPATQAIPVTTDTAADESATRRAIDRYFAKTALLGAAALAAFTLIYLLAIRIRGAWAEFVRSYARSERRYFRDLNKALAGNDERTAYRALDAWVQRLGFRSIEEWSRHTGDADLQQQVSAFQHFLFGRPDPDLPPAPVCDLGWAIARARRQCLKSARRSVTAQMLLPPLNP